MQSKRFPKAQWFLIALLLLANACNRTAARVAAVPPAPSAAGTSLPQLVSPSGKTYSRARVPGEEDPEPVVIPALPPGAAPNLDTYVGTARKAAKLSMASGTPKNFSDLGDLMDTLVPDSQMTAMHISKTADSARLPQEEVLVTVTAFLYASSRESDNDFHCIVGRDPSQSVRFMNVEVSGLPASTSQFFLPLRTARNEFKTFFTANGDGLPSQGYDKYTPPIAITVTGSLFFDVDHVPPAVGPTGMKPLTAWEIHPVSDIRFEQPQLTSRNTVAH
jgi:hypothetical protein